jgi:hypothetical protein
MVSYKTLLTTLATEQAKAAAHQAQARRLEKEIRTQQGQLNKSAHAAIGAAILRGIVEGWVKVDAEKLRDEAVAALPARWRDSIEVIADLVAEAKAGAPETAAAKVVVPANASVPAEPDSIDDLIESLTEQVKPEADETASHDVGVPRAAIESDKPAGASPTAVTGDAPALPPTRRFVRPGVVRPVPRGEGAA